MRDEPKQRKPTVNENIPQDFLGFSKVSVS